MTLRGKILIFAGSLCLVAALGLVGYNVYDDVRAAREALLAKNALEQATPTIQANNTADDIPAYLLAPYMDMPTTTIDGYDYIGVIDLPTIDISLPVMSECSYDRMRIAPCRYAGSAYLKNMVIAGHDYYSHLGKIASLSVGDSVVFTDAVGNVFTYEVSNLETLGAYDTKAMKESDAHLTLFTCTLDGTRRITVRCIEKDSEPSLPAGVHTTAPTSVRAEGGNL